jgi:hypothetical protein
MKWLRSSEFTPWGVTFCRGLNRALHCYTSEPGRRVQVQSDGRGRKIVLPFPRQKHIPTTARSIRTGSAKSRCSEIRLLRWRCSEDSSVFAAASVAAAKLFSNTCRQEGSHNLTLSGGAGPVCLQQVVFSSRFARGRANHPATDGTASHPLIIRTK